LNIDFAAGDHAQKAFFVQVPFIAIGFDENDPSDV
jgi:hypothetical protein